MKGIIEEDELYLPTSFKGNKKAALNISKELQDSDYIPDYELYGYRDAPHKRGGCCNERGLSKEQICVATALDESRSVIGKPVCAGNVSLDGLI